MTAVPDLRIQPIVPMPRHTARRGANTRFRAAAPVCCVSRVGLALAAVLFGAASLSPSLVVAQEDPFGEGPAKPAGKPDAAVGKPSNLPETIESDPAVLAVRDSKPTTPDQLAWAVRVTLDLGRPDEAKRYLDQLAAANPNDAQWVSLHARFGAEFFRRLKKNETLQPTGAKLADTALDAVRRESVNQNRLTNLVAKLSDSNPVTRRDAEAGLRQAGVAAVEPLVKGLADDGFADEHPAMQRQLVALGPQIVEALIGVLESDDPKLAARIIPVLGALKSRRAIGHLLRPALTNEPDWADAKQAAVDSLTLIVGEPPKIYDATQFLYRRALSHLKGEPVVRLDLDNRGELWHWDAAGKAARPQQYLASDLGVVEARRLARELYRLAPGKEDHRRLFLLTDLEADKIAAGVDQPLPRGAGTALERARKESVGMIEDVLAFSLKQQRYIATAAAIEVLGEIGDVDLLQATDGAPRLLAAALNHSDRRVRFMAVATVLKLDPQWAYPGASYLADSLGFLAASVGSRRALVAHPHTTEAQSWAGKLAELGFDADAAQTGRSAFILAQKNPDYEFCLISDSIQGPPISELVQMLRQEARTARLSIGAIAQGESLDRVQRLSETNDLVEGFPRPVDTESMATLVRRLQEGIGRSAVTRDERLLHAAAALEWLAKLTENDHAYSFYQLSKQEPAIETAMQTPELASRAAAVLGHFGTARAQLALVDLASHANRPIADRRAAAAAFKEAVRRRGLMLTREEIARQYERYNQSANADRETQKVLGSILDAFERQGAVADAAKAQPAPSPTPATP